MSRRRPITWIAFTVGIALLLSSCFGGGGAVDLTIEAEPTPEAIYEPAGSPGLDSFFPLGEQLDMFNADLASAVSASDQSDAETASPSSTITTIGLGGPTEEDVKTGLYGGTADETCNPERLIQYLLDNPDKGQVWADVQGIKFVEIPDYIRSLRVDILTEDTQVLNHGFDPKGHAIPIVSTLAAGTAVLVDDDNQIRTRCYCGNPILPYTPTTYMPPKCLSHYAVVYSAPNDRKEIDGVPRSVKATLQIANYDGVDWKEITWGNGTGWVRSDEASARYCKPAEKPDCVTTAQVLNRPGSQEVIGEIDRGHISVLAGNVEGWTLIKFADRSGWIQASQMGGQDCQYEVVCVASTSGTWTRPGQNGSQIVDNGTAQLIELTGQSYIDQTGTYLQAYVTYPAPTRLGYVNATDLSERDRSDCQTSIRCSHFDFDATVYEESTGTATYGILWFTEVSVISGPINDRYEIDWGTATGWVDVGDLQGYACERTVVCVQFYGSLYEPIPDSSGTRSAPSGAVTIEFTGRIADNGTTTFKELVSSAVSGGPAWVETQTGYNTINYGDCERPICDRPYVWNGEQCVPPETCEDRTPIPPDGGCCPRGGVYQQSQSECEACPELNLPELANLSNVQDDSPNDCCPAGYADGAEFGCFTYCTAATEGLILDENGNTVGSFAPGDVIFLGEQRNLSGVGLVLVADANDATGFIRYNPELQICNPEVSVEEIECVVAPGRATVGTEVAGVISWVDPSIPLDVQFDWKNGSLSSYSAQSSPVIDPFTFTSPGGGNNTLHVSWTNIATGETGQVECEVFIEGECREDQLRTEEGCVCREGEAETPDGCVRTLGLPPTPIPTPTVTPAPDATAVPTPAPTATAIAESTPVPTATQICPNGANANGDCLQICAPGDLNLNGICICSDGFRLDGINGCVVVCPGNQIPINSTRCGCPEGQVLEGSNCTQPLVCNTRQVLVDGVCIDDTPLCIAPQVLSGNTCVDPLPNCVAPQVLEGNVCVTVCIAPQIPDGTTCVDPLPNCVAPQVLEGNVCVTVCIAPQIPDGTTCVDPIPTCEVGYNPSDRGCVSSNNSCPHPDLDYWKGGCISRSGCLETDSRHFISNNWCRFDDSEPQT